MTFPLDTKVGDLFWVNEEPVRITAWNYAYGTYFDTYFDIQFLDLNRSDGPMGSMVLIPMGYNFYGTEIRKMSSLEKELF
jgi:hypothetical protein